MTFSETAINICFSMPEIFKPDILASVMQHYLDSTTLPLLFLRTVRTNALVVIYLLIAI